MTPQERYIELLKKSVLNELYLEHEVRLKYIFASAMARAPIDPAVVQDVRGRLPDWVAHAEQAREEGRLSARVTLGSESAAKGAASGKRTVDLRNVTEFSHTMIGRKRLDNLTGCLDRIRADGIPGDLAETGVWRGGAAIIMRGYLAAWDMPDRRVWAADSFEGLPPPSRPEDAGLDLSAAKMPILAVPLEEVQRLFAAYGLLDDRVVFLKGWFRDTLPTAPIERLALLRLDGDLYESTMDGLTSLYDKVSDGGFVIVDDYGDLEPCRRAVDEFRTARGITDPIERIDWTGVYWRKGG